MSKALAICMFVIAALCAAILLLPDGNSSDHKQGHPKAEAKPAQKTKPIPLPPSVLPKVNGQEFNLESYWVDPKTAPPFSETVAFTQWDVMPKPGAVHFSVTPEGVRLKLGPGAEVLKAKLRYGAAYLPGTGPHHYPSWDGKGAVPLTETITNGNGKQYKAKLREILVQVFDPRFLHSDPPAKSQLQS